MAEKWQQWMPFHIDRFMGSRHVQMMHPVARIAYLYLLSSQWQSDDCTISADEDDLSILSGVGDLWLAYQKQVLRQFVVLPNGRLRNVVCFEEWETAIEKYEAYQARASKGGKGRMVTLNVLEASVKQAQASVKQASEVLEPTPYLTVPDHTEQEAKATPLAPSPKAGIVAVASPKFMDLPTNRTGQFFTVTEAHVEGWNSLYPAVDVRQQIRNIRGWLDSNPTRCKTHSGMPRCITRWLNNAQDKAPRSGDGKPSNNRAEDRNNRSRDNIARAAQSLGIFETAGADGADERFEAGDGFAGGHSDDLASRLDAAGERVRPTQVRTGAEYTALKPDILPRSEGNQGRIGGYGGQRTQ